MSRRPSRLITELLTFAKGEGWSVRDLAGELGVDETAIIRLRSGERSPSKQMLVRIAERFGEHKFVRDLVWYHLLSECQLAPDGMNSRDPLDNEAVPTAAAIALRRYVEHFAEESVQGGGGLYIASEDANALSAVLRALRLSFETAKVRLFVMRPNEKPRALEVRAALAAALLLVERIDFASDVVSDVIRRRADLTRPTIVTSMLPPDAIADPFLRRIARSTMRRIDLTSVAMPPPAHIRVPHAS